MKIYMFFFSFFCTSLFHYYSLIYLSIFFSRVGQVVFESAQKQGFLAYVLAYFETVTQDEVLT